MCFTSFFRLEPDVLKCLCRGAEEVCCKPVVAAPGCEIATGDPRCGAMAGRGELNVGQLMRERWGSTAFLVGFSTHSGTVTAASDWDKPAERKIVRPALDGSYEALFHELGLGNFLLGLRGNEEAVLGLRQPRLERAIGVIYRPETERMSHYFGARLPHQFDAVLHYDVTRAVEPLERTGLWERGELPETYPSTL